MDTASDDPYSDKIMTVHARTSTTPRLSFKDGVDLHDRFVLGFRHFGHDVNPKEQGDDDERQKTKTASSFLKMFEGNANHEIGQPIDAATETHGRSTSALRG